MTAPPNNHTILVLGATGYIGGRLIGELVDAGHQVRCLARTPSKLEHRPWRSSVEVVKGDLLDRESLGDAFEGIDVAYYLVHSLGVGDDFEQIERRCAENAASAAEDAGLTQLIYLGGLGEASDDLSPHLRSRQEVGRVLAAGATPVTELRAAIILGSGSASFEMLRGLTEILPVMTTPRWVQDTRCQPIAVRDVLRNLLDVLGRTDLAGVWEMGGEDVLTYEGVMRAYAEAADLGPRVIIGVPVLTPRLSARWVGLVTDLPTNLATELVESLQNDVVVTGRPLSAVLPRETLDLPSALKAALAEVQDLNVPTRWTGGAPQSGAALPRPWDPDWAGGTVLEDERSVRIDAPVAAVMTEVRRLGGHDGWLGFGALWDLRGFADIAVGGDGRRSRRHPTELAAGDVVDMFRVEEATPSTLRLRAEMKMPGFGWLEWSAEEVGQGQTRLTQHARFVPKGVLGRLYWLSLVPFHGLVFTRMLASLAERAESTTVLGHPIKDQEIAL